MTPSQLWRFLVHRTTRYLLSWLIVGLAFLMAIQDAEQAFSKVRIREQASISVGGAAFSAHEYFGGDWRTRNDGHATIDFGGQWLMGRMLFEGHGRELYNRDVQRAVLTEHYPDYDRDPDSNKNDVENLMEWLIGNDEESNLGGPLYPPINAFLAYPLANWPPVIAYRINQAVNLLLLFVAGGAVALLSRRKIWLPVAVAILVNYPGFMGSLNLGQNATLTLSILLWGWVLIDRNRPLAGGVIWGLLAFKPVWALSYLFVLLLTRRWRASLAMIATGALLAAATLPIVGWDAWMNWLQVGRAASELYKTDYNWIHLSRDLLGLPRRWFPDLVWGPNPLWPRGIHAAEVVGWAMVLFAAGSTAGLALWRWRENRATTGHIAAFLLMGGWLCCYHFMYYDVLLTALPVFALFADPERFLRPIVLRTRALFRRGDVRLELQIRREPASTETTAFLSPRLARSYPLSVVVGTRSWSTWVFNSFTMYLLLTLYLYKTYCWVINRSWRHLHLLVALIGSVIPLGSLPPYSMDYHFGPPWELCYLIVLWFWCGILWTCDPRVKPMAVAQGDVSEDVSQKLVPVGG